MKIREKIRKVLDRNPHWGAQTVAEHLGVDIRSLRVTASVAGIKFMNRRQLEEIIDERRSRQASHQDDQFTAPSLGSEADS